jgi:hypothetical protein
MSIIFEPSLLPTCFVASNSTIARNAKGVARKNRISTDVRVDDTGIEPVTPTMLILAYARQSASRVLSSNVFTLN